MEMNHASFFLFTLRSLGKAHPPRGGCLWRPVQERENFFKFS